MCTRSNHAFASWHRYRGNDNNEISMITVPNVLMILVYWISYMIYREGVELQLCPCWRPLMCCFLNQEDANVLLDMARRLSAAAQFDQFNEEIVRKLSLCASGNLAPINAFIGGLAAQEVMKVRMIERRQSSALQEWWYLMLVEVFAILISATLLTAVLKTVHADYVFCSGLQW